MPWRDALEPARMTRVAVVTPLERVRPALVALGGAGVVEPEILDHAGGAAEAALQRLRARFPDVSAEPTVTLEQPDLDHLESDHDAAALAGEMELERVRASMISEDSVAAIAGWVPATSLGALGEALASCGAAAVRLSPPRGVEPPTALRRAPATAAFQPLVNTYGTVPYADLNPSLLAGVAYVVMFGMMFGDVGHGALLLALGGALAWASHRSARWRLYRWAAPFVIGAGLTSIGFGFAYGEAFGPTGLVPTLWLRPLSHATTLLLVAVAIGAVLLAASFTLGAINRFREGGVARALVALSGVAGATLYLGLAVAGAGVHWHHSVVALVGAGLVVLALALGFLGLYAEAGGRASGTLEAGVELFDAVLRLGTNTVSFARLAAFGLTHAALSDLVWSGTVSLWHTGGLVGVAGAVVLFALGNALTFALEALVAGVQALRLEYYEIFSRVFSSEGREFHPWRITVRQ